MLTPSRWGRDSLAEGSTVDAGAVSKIAADRPCREGGALCLQGTVEESQDGRTGAVSKKLFSSWGGPRVRIRLPPAPSRVQRGAAKGPKRSALSAQGTGLVRSADGRHQSRHDAGLAFGFDYRNSQR